MFFSSTTSALKPTTASFEDIQDLLSQQQQQQPMDKKTQTTQTIQTPNKNKTLINILPSAEQACLIEGTLSISAEEQTINDWVKSGKAVDHCIILYGKNTDDAARLEKKRRDLRALGFHDVFVYPGGLFEWLLLQDIYGRELFPTTSHVLDILAFRPSRREI
jgi:hypothetical protein